jgi:hypothetical protein
MSRLTRVIAPLLARAGLDVHAISGADGQVHELVVTNPRQPAFGRVVINREGLMKWDYWGHIASDPGAADLATVVTAIMATPISSQPDHHAGTATTQPPAVHEPTRETR